MSSLGSPTQRTRSTDEILRTVLNAILEEKIKNQGVKTQIPVVTVSAYETVELSDANPTITSTAAGGYTYEDAVGIWRFNTGSTLIVVDESGFGNHGTATGMTWVAGKYGYGGGFDGVDDYAETSSTNESNFDLSSTDFTIMHWINASTIPADVRTTINKWADVVANDNYAFFFVSSQYRFYWNDGAEKFVTFSGFASTTWHHVTLVRSGTTMTGFLDGAVVTTAVGVGTLNTNNQNLTFGRQKVSNSRFYNGNLDEIRIYNNRALSTTEIVRASQNSFSYYDRSDYA